MLRGLGEIRREERLDAVVAFATLTALIAGHTLLETARDALFLASLPATHLPWVYLAIAVLALVVFEVRRRAKRRVSPRVLLPGFLLAGGVITAGLWLLSDLGAARSLYALYVWTGLFATVSVLQFWLVITRSYNVVQAKRIFGFIGGGSILGAIGGALGARLITHLHATQHLLLAAAVTILVAGGCALLLARRLAGRPGGAPEPRDETRLVDQLRALRSHPYLKRVGALALSATVAITIADYLFKATVKQRVEPAELGDFFATTYIILNVLAFVVQVGLVGWVLDRFGVHRALWVLPIALAAGGVWLLLGGALYAVLVLKGSDGALRHSLHKTSTEVLYVPLADAVRARAKQFIDVLGHRGGQALASIAILAIVALDVEWVVLPLVLVVVAAAWVLVAGSLRQHYLDLFRDTLREDVVRTRSSQLPPLDQGALEALFAALSSADDREVRASLELLAEQGKVKLVPALILHHPSSAVVLRALELFADAGRKDFVPIAGRLLGHGDPRVRAAAVRAIAAVEANERVFRRALEDASSIVRSTGLVGLVSTGALATDEARAAVDRLLAEATPEARLALAEAIRHHPAPGFVEVLLRLAREDDPAVKREVVRAMAELRSPRFMPELLPLLAHRELRDEVRAALVAIGAPALAALRAALDDRTLPFEVRLHVPRSISRFPPPQAAPILVDHLLREDAEKIRFKILRGLGRLRAHEPDLPLDSEVLQKATEGALRSAYRLLDWRVALLRGAEEDPQRATPAHEVLAALLDDKERHALERVFRLLGLQHPHEDFRHIWRGLRSRNDAVRASSRELFEHVVNGTLREAVLGLVIDGLTPEERLERASAFYTPRARDLPYDALLENLLGSGSASVAALTAYHVSELGVRSLRPRLEELRQTKGHLAEVVERALAMLGQPRLARVAHG